MRGDLGDGDLRGIGMSAGLDRVLLAENASKTRLGFLLARPPRRFSKNNLRKSRRYGQIVRLVTFSLLRGFLFFCN